MLTTQEIRPMKFQMDKQKNIKIINQKFGNIKISCIFVRQNNDMAFSMKLNNFFIMKAILIIKDSKRVFANLNGQTFEVSEILFDDVVLKGTDLERTDIPGTFSHKEVFIVDLDKEFRFLESVEKDPYISELRIKLATADKRNLMRYCLAQGIEYTI